MKRLFTVLAVLVALGVAAAAGGYAYWQSRLAAPLALDEPLLYQVPEGAGFHQVIAELGQQGVIADPWALKVLARVYPQKVPALRVGEYRLMPDMDSRELMALLGSNNVVTYSLTVPEGWTFAQMRERLDEAQKLKHRTAGKTDAEVLELIEVDKAHPEGWFFPDTYQYHRGMSDTDILRQAHARMAQMLDQAWASRADELALDTPYEALIMASLIERETGVPEERREIAGVFSRRLKRGMRLQTDPTVIYGMGRRYDGNITRADLREKTPYNTYVIDGLPPTPIALPGKAALDAAVNPLDGNTLYFVAKGDGSHYFSRSLREHNNAVNRFIRSDND
ncbi:endolytic transglycosylase MltG [Halomonas cibimaris]|uniref:Endolytic murein transglycosylase n=1 Tax=Halomonas cibimaris TaxID=657012 RepID=A0ABP7LQJ3_9GAMM